MHGIQFLQDLAVVMIVAAVVTIIFHRFKQPVVLGYILAGLIVGPHTPPFPLIHDANTINVLAELGVILLMFALGLEFSLRKLKKVGASAFIAALFEILLMIWVGYEVGRWFGWRTMDSIFLGAILSISSTTIIIKALNDLGKAKEPFAQLIFGILIIEDILGIALIALLSGIAMTGTLSIGEVGTTLAKLGIFLTTVLVAGLLIVPRLISYVARFRSNEMLLITVLGLCFGFALLAAKLGYSVALGAFLIGAVIAETREIHRIEALTEPVRDMFSAIFFVTIGLLIDPKVIATYWVPILIITAAVVIGKTISCSFGAFAGGNDNRTSLRVGMGLAQIGEFSFIIASLGLTLKVTSDFLYPVAVAVSALTTLLTPYLIKSADMVVNRFDRTAPTWLIQYLELYTAWVGQWKKSGSPGLAKPLIRKWTWQIALNMLLASGIFIAASFIGQRKSDALIRLAGSRELMNGVLWLSAVVLSMPILIATYRKAQALGMLLGELAVQRSNLGTTKSAVQTIISNTVPTVAAVGMGLLILVLSSAILPSGSLLVALLSIGIVIGILLWRNMIRIYSKAQFALIETFRDVPATPPVQAPTPQPFTEIFKEAKVEMVTVGEHSAWRGKLIRELAVRTTTGASIVGIERNGTSIVSPGPDEELYAGDRILLLGSSRQIEAARNALNMEASDRAA